MTCGLTYPYHVNIRDQKCDGQIIYPSMRVWNLFNEPGTTVEKLEKLAVKRTSLVAHHPDT